MSKTLGECFTDHHRACDEALAGLEQVLAGPAPGTAAALAGPFVAALRVHFGAEEELLFPALELAMGAGGPASVMRSEHRQIEGLVAELEGALQAGRDGDAAALVDTLFSLLQSHNMKEEQILYPMCERALAAQPGLARQACDRLGSAPGTPA